MRHMEVGRKGSDWQPCQPDALVQGLRCPVCLDYFQRPHTLGCGHSFCLSCLRTLARVTRYARNRAPLDRIRFRCPSCRKMTLARPILSRRASVNYALKELVDEWFSSPYSAGSVDCLSLRSIATQTKDENSNVADRSQLNTMPADEDFQKSLEDDDSISKEEFRDILFHRIDSKSNKDIKPSPELLPEVTDESGLSDELVTSSSDDSESGQEDIPLLGDLRVIGVDNEPRLVFNRWHATNVSGVLRIFLSELLMVCRGIRESRSRTVLTLFWFLYGGLVVCVSRGFLPWMAFYTVIYFLILYAEMSQPAVFGRQRL